MVALSKLAGVVVAGVSLMAVGALVFQVWRGSNAKEVGRLTSILIYPIKACPPINVDSAECTSAGLKYKAIRDR